MCRVRRAIMRMIRLDFFNMNAEEQTKRWIEQDLMHCWHPFTPQALWGREAEVIMLQSGQGVWLTDSLGRRYIDGNSSIWVNIHGHGHPHIVRAIQQQASTLCHSSYLGFGHGLASELATRLVALFPENSLTRVFFSDDGSTAVESALKMAFQSCSQTPGREQRRHFVAFSNCYHGDTMGAASLGGVSTFFSRFRGFGIEVKHVRDMAELRALPQDFLQSVAGIVIEPGIQGVNRMTPWPKGLLRELRAFCDAQGIFLICDEVMTGFGRTGKMFACMHEDVTPDFLCCAKGLTGGYTPMAACLTTEAVYESFLGTYSENKSFYYGHSFTAHPIGCAAALAGLDVFEQEHVLENLPPKIALMAELGEALAQRCVHVTAVRQCGMVMGIDIARADGSPYEQDARAGERACMAMRRYGLLTRPVTHDTLVLMPPLCISEDELRLAFRALEAGIREALVGDLA